MGVAAYNRGTTALSRMIDGGRRPVEFEIMDRLNSLEKYPDAGRPFGTIQFLHDSRGFWVAECPITGFGFFYKTLTEAVRRWLVTITAFDNGKWLASPRNL